MKHYISPRSGMAFCAAIYETLTNDIREVDCGACLNMIGNAVRSVLCKHPNAVALAGTYDSYKCPDCGDTVKARYFEGLHPAFDAELGDDE